MDEKEVSDTKAARDLILKDKQDREKSCQEELVALLAKYSCELVPSLTIAAGQVNHNLAIVAKV